MLRSSIALATLVFSTIGCGSGTEQADQTDESGSDTIADTNFDPERYQTSDTDALNSLMTEVGLERLPDDGDTHRLLYLDLDLVLVRGWPRSDSVNCSVRFLDPDDQSPMFDHAFVACR